MTNAPYHLDESLGYLELGPIFDARPAAHVVGNKKYQVVDIAPWDVYGCCGPDYIVVFCVADKDGGNVEYWEASTGEKMMRQIHTDVAIGNAFGL